MSSPTAESGVRSSEGWFGARPLVVALGFLLAVVAAACLSSSVTVYPSGYLLVVKTPPEGSDLPPEVEVVVVPDRGRPQQVTTSTGPFLPAPSLELSEAGAPTRISGRVSIEALGGGSEQELATPEPFVLLPGSVEVFELVPAAGGGVDLRHRQTLLQPTPQPYSAPPPKTPTGDPTPQCPAAAPATVEVRVETPAPPVPTPVTVSVVQQVGNPSGEAAAPPRPPGVLRLLSLELSRSCSPSAPPRERESQASGETQKETPVTPGSTSTPRVLVVLEAGDAGPIPSLYRYRYRHRTAETPTPPSTLAFSLLDKQEQGNLPLAERTPIPLTGAYVATGDRRRYVAEIADPVEGAWLLVLEQGAHATKVYRVEIPANPPCMPTQTPPPGWPLASPATSTPAR